MNPSMHQSKGNKQWCVLIEIGQSLTRVGFAGEPIPSRVVHTRRFINPSNNQSISQSINEQRWPAWSVEKWQQWLIPYLKHLMLDLLGIHNQSINQSTNPSINPYINQSLTQLINPNDRRVCFIESLTQPLAMKQALILVAYHLGFPSIMFAQSTACASLALHQSSNQSNNQSMDSIVIDIGMFDTCVLITSKNQSIASSVKFCPIGCAHIIERFAQLVDEPLANQPTHQSTSLIQMPWRIAEDFAVTVVQAINQSKLSANQSSNQATNPPADMEVTLTSDRPYFISTLDSFNQSIFCQPSEQSLNQSINQCINQSISVSIPSIARLTCCDVLFGFNEEGYHLMDALVDCLVSLSLETRKSVIRSIIVTGGGSEIAGMKERIYNEIMTRMTNHPVLTALASDVRMSGKEPVTPSLVGWFGASIYASVMLDDDEQWLDRNTIRQAIEQEEASQSMKQPVIQKQLNNFWSYLPQQFRDWSYYAPMIDTSVDIPTSLDDIQSF